MKKLLAIALVIFLGNACNNYNLLDKLENPGGTGSSQEKLLAFVASVTTDGIMSSYNAGLFVGCAGFTGQGRADCACQTMATNAALPKPKSGKYISFTSITGNDMRCRIQGIIGAVLCPIPSGGPVWTNVNGVPVANGYAGLFSGSLMAPLDLTETKVTAASLGITATWTGTNTDGSYNGTQNNCSDWTITSVNSATTGQPTAQNANWVNAGTTSCALGTTSVYCFAQP